jgi:hypothetical protein
MAEGMFDSALEMGKQIAAPFFINREAAEYARKLRIAEDTNYDEIDNKYDAIRHIGGALALYSQYPDFLADRILNAKEWMKDTERGHEMDYHNNAIAKELYNMLDAETAGSLSTEQALEIAKSYIEEWELADKENRTIDLPDSMRPLYYYKEPTKPQKSPLEPDQGLMKGNL